MLATSRSRSPSRSASASTRAAGLRPTATFWLLAPNTPVALALRHTLTVPALAPLALATSRSRSPSLSTSAAAAAVGVPVTLRELPAVLALKSPRPLPPTLAMNCDTRPFPSSPVRGGLGWASPVMVMATASPGRKSALGSNSTVAPSTERVPATAPCVRNTLMQLMVGVTLLGRAEKFTPSVLLAGALRTLLPGATDVMANCARPTPGSSNSNSNKTHWPNGARRAAKKCFMAASKKGESRQQVRQRARRPRKRKMPPAHGRGHSQNYRAGAGRASRLPSKPKNR